MNALSAAGVVAANERSANKANAIAVAKRHAPRGAFADVAMVALVMGHFVLKRLNAALCGVLVSSAKVFEERGGSDCVEIVARSRRSERRP